MAFTTAGLILAAKVTTAVAATTTAGATAYSASEAHQAEKHAKTLAKGESRAIEADKQKALAKRRSLISSQRQQLGLDSTFKTNLTSSSGSTSSTSSTSSSGSSGSSSNTGLLTNEVLG